MTEEHTHDHKETEDEEHYITLVDDEGNEELFEILLTIDGQEEFGKNYVLVIPAGSNDGEGEIEISAYSFTQNDDGTEGNLLPIPEDSEDEWAMIEDVFNQFSEQEDEAE